MVKHAALPFVPQLAPEHELCEISIVYCSLKRAMNKKQSTGIYLAVAVILFIFFLHSPWSGYETIEFLSLTDTDPLFYNLSNGYLKLGFWDWHSRTPIVPWLGVLKNLAATVIFIVLLTFIWMAASRDSNK